MCNTKMTKMFIGSLVLLLVCGIGVKEASGDPRPTNPDVRSNTFELLSYQDSGYRFLNILPGAPLPPDGLGRTFEEPDYDDLDVGFHTGSAAFGSGGSCPLQQTVKTNWRTDSHLLVRRFVSIPPGVTNIRVTVSVDNDILGVFFNGTPLVEHTLGTKTIIHDGCPILDEFRFDVPLSLVQPEPHLVAFHVLDRGRESFFDARILADLTDLAPWDLVSFTGLPATGSCDVDVTPRPCDENRFLLNPRWGWQTPGTPPPEFSKSQSSQITGTDNSNTCSIKSGGRDGHVNWFDVTYTGTLRWDGHDRHYPYGDDDYNIKIFGPTVPGTSFMAGGTAENPDNVKGEFDSDETIDRFDQSAWWRMFRQAVDADGFNTRGAGTRAGAMIDGHDAVMTGLMGLDSFHSDNKSEIHPVHALAIRIADTPNPANDAWAVFVRNWGNEGYCGNNQHYVDRTSISIRIPRPPGISPSAIPHIGTATAIFTNNRLHPPFDWVVNAIPRGDAIVTFILNTPTRHTYQFGELHLVWTPTGGVPLASMTTGGSPITNMNAVVRTAQTVDEEEGPEESAEERALFKSLSPAEQEAIETSIQAARPPVDDASEPARGIVVVGVPEPPPEDQIVFVGRAERVQEIREVSLKAGCAATDNVQYQSFICERLAVAPAINVDDMVSFEPLRLTFKTTSDTTGCPSGFGGKFSFSAALTNKKTSLPLSDIIVLVRDLTGGNFLQNADGGLGTIGSSLTVPDTGGFADGELSPGESVDVPFVVCLKERKPFRFFVDVLGTVSEVVIE